MKLQGLSIESEGNESIVRSEFSTTEDIKVNKNAQKSKGESLGKVNSQKMIMRSNSSSRISKMRGNPIEKKLQLKPKESRFKEITVFEHLYQTSKRL
jgi:hypothetical protein